MTVQENRSQKWTIILRISLVLLFCGSLFIEGLDLFSPSYGSVSADGQSINATTQTLVSGTINTNTTWTLAGSPYIVTGNLFVSAGVQLTIEPGVVVRIQASKGMQVDGTLIARGTNAQPITFTSDSATPASGDWVFVKLTDSSMDATFDGDGNYLSGSILEYAIVEYGGGGGTSGQAAFIGENAAPFMNHNTFRNNKHAFGLGSFSTSVVSRVTNNLIDGGNNSGGIGITGNSIVSNNTVMNTTTGLSVSVNSGQTCDVSKNLVKNNMNIGGIRASGPGVKNIIENTVENNRSSDGGIYTNSGTTFISKNIINGNQGGGIQVDASAVTITDNIITNNSGGLDGGGIAFSLKFLRPSEAQSFTGVVTNNRIAGNSARNGGGIAITFGTYDISNNSFINNTADTKGSAIYCAGNDGNLIQNNTFTRHSGSSLIEVFNNPTIQNNNFYNNSTLYTLYCRNSSNFPAVDATQNWWGTTSDTEIQDRIFDRIDDLTVGTINYLPIRNSFNLSAPVSPPTGLVVSLSSGGSINLTWQANPETDVAGYKVYYDTNPGFPYTGTGASQGASAIDVGNVNNFAISGLPPGVYYFAVTAYDTDKDGIDDQAEGHESWFSVEAAESNLHADLSLTNSASVDPIPALGEVTYTIIVTNNGPDRAESLVVTDNIPSNIGFLDCTSTNGGICGGSGNNRTVTLPTLAANSSATITFTASLGCTQADGTIISNSASVTSLAHDANPANNTAIEEVTVSNPPPVLSPTSESFPYTGGTGNVGMTSTVGCGFATRTNDSWITINSVTGDPFNATISYTVAANNNPTSRTGTMSIAEQTFTVTQLGNVCAFSVVPTSRFHGSGTTTDIVSVMTQSPCTWTATSQAPWIMITSGASGTGNGTVFYTILANSGQARTGTMTIAGQTVTITQAGGAAAFSFDGDAKSDISVWRPSTGVWHIINSSNSSTTAVGWGIPGDKPVSGNYDGDGKADIAIWRPSTGVWFIINSSNSSVKTQGWGINGDVPVPGDYDGDGKTDIAIWRPSTGVWYIINSHDNSVTAVLWGESTDKAVPGDYDGDGKTDIAVWRPGNGRWLIMNSSNGAMRTEFWGINSDKPVVGDYDGDGKSDIAIWRPSTGVWYIINSLDTSITTKQWGVSTDILVPADYDGDGKTDVAIWRPANGLWFIVGSAGGSIPVITWGINADIPVPSVGVP